MSSPGTDPEINQREWPTYYILVPRLSIAIAAKFKVNRDD